MTVLDTAGAYTMQGIRVASEEAQARLQAAGVRKPDAVFGSNIDGPNISLVWQDDRNRTELVFDGSDQPQLIEIGDGPWDQRIGNVLGRARRVAGWGLRLEDLLRRNEVVIVHAVAI